MHKQDINSTFAAIRQAPLEVDYNRIEAFVLSQPAVNRLSSSKWKQWLKKTKFNMLLLIIGSMLLFLLPLNLLNDSTFKTNDVPFVPEKINETNTQEELPLNNQHSQPAITAGHVQAEDAKPVILADVKKAAAAMHQPLPDSKQADVTHPESNTDQNLNEAIVVDTAPVRVRTYTSNFCTFEGEDLWIKAFLKTLKADGVIRDTVGLQFVFSLKEFIVNGIVLDEYQVSKYNLLYQSVTGKSLNMKSKISLSVGGSSCTLTKVIDD